VNDRGSGSVWLLGVGLAVVLFGGMVAHVELAIVARHRAEAAADLGALAGAVRAAEGADAACARAGLLVAANGARLAGCRVDGLDVTVTADVDLPDGIGPAHATARAGPARAGPGSD